MKHKIGKKLKVLVGALALATLSACSGGGDSPDETGTIIGTGISLEGTATSNKRFASNTVELRSRSGERASGSIDDMGRFKVTTTTGEGPWLVRSDLGNNDYLYGIATNLSANAQVQNIHSYSDAVVRNWYATKNLNVDTVFASTDTNATMPSQAEANAIYTTLISVVSDVIDNYGITGVDLNTAEFVANGGDIDKFILQNPVIRNEDSISIIVFDPLNNATSLAVANFMLGDDITSVDTTAPSAPGRLRALPSAMDEITLVWDVATDNVGIARYAISRNGEEIATSPYPVYVDGGLTPGMTNSYSVVAIDATGNRSAPTVTVNALPLATVDTTAPPAPVSLLIDTRRGSLDLEWNLSDVSDVASFIIKRGTGPTALSEYTNVTSTYLFDEAVNAGVQYCYTVTAVDASGNPSPEVGPTCATVPGAVVNVAGNTPPPAVVVAPTGGLTAPQLDVSSMACTTTIPVTSVRTDTTITAGCYLSDSDIRVSEPATLTLEPGVVIKFFTGHSLNVANGAGIIAMGTATNPIVLTGTETTPGHWRGVEMSSSSARNVFDHVQIEYAGSGSNAPGGLNFTSLGLGARVAVSNSTFRFNAAAGMNIDNNIALSSFDGNRYTGNAVPVETDGDQAFLLDKRSVYTGNTVDAILVPSANIRTDVDWPALAVPYHIESALNIYEGVFNLEAGATVKFDADARLFIATDDIEFNGTAEAPITLSGIDETKGSWEGIYFNSVDDAVLRHVTVQHGGGDDQNAAIQFIDSQRVVFDNVTLKDNLGVGIESTSNTNFAEFTNVTITGNDGIANVNFYAAVQFNNPGNFLGNTEDVIEINSGRVTDLDAVLSNSQVDYISDDIALNNATLTLEQGVNLIMRKDTDISVRVGASLVTNGTAAQPVSIVGFERTAGYWDGIRYSVTAGETNRLTHTLVADGGGDFDSSAANLMLTCATNSLMTIENSQFENSAGFGIHVPSSGCSVDIDATTTFMNNALGDMN